MIWVVLVALAVGFIRTLMTKWGILEWLQAHSHCELISRMLGCEFCLSFWIGVFLSIFLAVLVDPVLILVPIFSSNLR